ncbi:hypothetical protein [Cupriavidus oxalaticus]|jgi:hypothetical protein|uniref:Uncharacterized protein n=1 Tax=Cupriavidus oxalaticus TaxID=96344 RepID=A0A375GIT6_9BURK|nr:hypothetical protein [Cupriavidus oxalaticus]QEZ43841.1 hypothetical protein D2917_06060 [Cupriavidus oxalaticus]QRQ84752.1 hypothetical protein JTE91_01225 [Cupriavidus oxalaticus]QRQ91159.1 hypothetical protein JTE92_11120 [Cupriavidus oxalaticus]WQD85707.1 hypothetical protein U0036_29255 [Cupriavidus oxalaticus]SPC20779.1 conserved exported hypothetical protein [Cupriavidus oxalaticus]
MTSRFSKFPRIPRFLGAAAGTLVLLASSQAFASTVVVAPASVYVRPQAVVVAPPPKVVVKPAPKVVVASAPLPTVVVKATQLPRNVYVASRPVYLVR